jgi:TrmH family RNA methyltransferase
MTVPASRPIEEITSPHNPLVSLVRSLAQRKYREETGLFAVEGLAFASKAMKCGLKARHVLLNAEHCHDDALRAIIDKARSGGAQIAAVPKSLLSRITGKDNPQKLVLAAEQRWATALPAEVHEGDVVLALDRVRDPRNLGAIIRTAEAAGVRTLVLIGSCCDPWSPEAVRASAGSLFSLPVMKAANGSFRELTSCWTGDVIGTDVAAAADFRHPRRGPVLLVMGNESDGLSEELALACTRLVHIPMMPGVSSLNLAAAAALMLYELRLPLIGP